MVVPVVLVVLSAKFRTFVQGDGQEQGRFYQQDGEWRWSSPCPISPTTKWTQSSAATTATPTGSCPRRSSSTWFGGIQEIGKWWGSARQTPWNLFPGLLSKIEPEVILALPRILAEVVGERQGARQLPQGEDIQKVQFKMRLGEEDSLWLTQVLNKQSCNC